MSNRIMIDVLTPKIEDCPWFLVDNTLLQVPVNQGNVNPVAFKNGIGSSVFAKGDTCQIVSTGLFLPFSFTFGEIPAGFPVWCTQLYFARDPAWGTPIGIPHMADNTNGQLLIPYPNYELFIDVPHQIIFNNADQRHEFQFQLQIVPGQNPQISMVNVPDSMNDITYHVIPWIKVLHNFPMEERL